MSTSAARAEAALETQTLYSRVSPVGVTVLPNLVKSPMTLTAGSVE